MTFWLLLSLFKSNWCNRDVVSKTQWIAVNVVNNLSSRSECLAFGERSELKKPITCMEAGD
jgi:hypothetical protein